MAAPPPFCGTAAPQILGKKSLRKHGFTAQVEIRVVGNDSWEKVP